MLVVHLLRKHKFRNEGPKGSDWPAQVHGIIYINIILFRSICFLINLMDNLYIGRDCGLAGCEHEGCDPIDRACGVAGSAGVVATRAAAYVPHEELCV